ncbi:MAG: GH92 family glycosyl hydrolase, partial [Planctomycetes bacterium]|nr:GH92 family glycosyl hydrolase [Planctomycetota bacterium]
MVKEIKPYIIVLLTFVLFALVGCRNSNEDSGPAKNDKEPAGTDRCPPNIVLVMTDDQGYGDLGRCGNPDIVTPNIDSFAEHAVVFNQFLCSPVCSPTRSSLLTGRYNYRTQAVDTFKGRSVMNPDEVTLAEMLKENSYKTGIFGKWHLGDNYPMRPQDQGFDEVLVHLGGGIGQPSDPEGGSSYFDPVLQHNGVETKFDGYCMDVYTDHALSFIEENRTRPFFVYLATNTPHAPWDDVPQKYREMYKDIPEPSGVYYGMISNIDDNFQRVLDKIDDLGLTDNTIVIFMSDNGQASAGARRYTAGLRGRKGTVYENGLRVPFFIRWPDGFSTTKTIETMAAHIDIFPTLLGAAGIAIPDSIKYDGRNLLPLIMQDDPPWEDRNIGFQFHRGNAPNLYQNSAIRSQNWKLINNRQIGEMGAVTPSFELYDLANDPGENINLAGDNPQKVSRMRAAYEQWFADVTSAGYDLPRAYIGTEHQNPVTFTKQDLWIPKGKPESNGYFRAYVTTAGKYNITLQFAKASSAGKTVRFMTQGADITATIPGGAKEFVFKNVLLKEGEHNLRAWKIDNGDKLTLRTIVEDVNLSARTPADYVNALMGTAPLTDMTLYGGPNYDPDPDLIGFSGTVYPGPDVPHGMVQLSPYNHLVGSSLEVDDTRYGSGYFYPDKSILGFGHTNKGHWRGGAVLMMPTVGDLQIVPGSLENPDGGYRSRFEHAGEEATAGYYSVVLDDYNIKVELSALTYTGFHRYTFPDTDEANILIDLGRAHRSTPVASFEIVDNTHIQGTQKIRTGQYSFYMEFSKPFKAYGTWKDGKVTAGSKSASGTDAGAYVTYSTTAGESIEVKVVLSRNSVADAKANWEAEAKGLGFEGARAKARRIWNDKLSMIEIEGGTPKQRENFYSTFYRSLQWPSILTDFSNDKPVYEWPSIWDTYRNKQPLLTLIEPEVKQNIVKSMVEFAKRDGKMYTHFHGNHASSIITASYLSGLDDFDIEAAYSYLKKNQTDRSITDSRHMQFLDEYLDNGYVSTVDPVPTETRKPSRSAVAKTMEYAFADGVMAILAEELSKTADAKMFRARSKNYKNVYEPTTGIMWGRKPNGDFVQPVKPMEPFHTYLFRESNAWQQTWFVPHDIAGLAELMGGRQGCIDKLDEFFSKPYEPEGTLIDIGGMIGQYNHGNQPDHHAPYIYNYLGQPWKTQKLVREIMDKMYRGNVYTGMDDCGEMSAWYVWSSMGIYPFNPSSLVYPIGSPIFERVTIHLPRFKYGGVKFVIEAKDVSKTNVYIQSATLNGAKYDKPWISFWEIAGGSTLVLQMGPNPSDWGTDLAN